MPSRDIFAGAVSIPDGVAAFSHTASLYHCKLDAFASAAGARLILLVAVTANGILYVWEGRLARRRVRA